MALFSFSGIRLGGLTVAIPKPGEGGGDIRVAPEKQTASDLGYEAAVQLLEARRVPASSIGAIIFLSRTPDYRSPATSIVLQGRLGIPIDCLAFDINMGGTGFVYALQTGCSLLQGITADYAMVIVGDTVNRQMAPGASSGTHDAATAILLEKGAGESIYIQTQSYTEGFSSWMIPEGGFRKDDPTAPDNLSKRPVIRQYIREDRATYDAIIEKTVPQDLRHFFDTTGLAASSFDTFISSRLNDTTRGSIADISGIPAEKWSEAQEAVGSTIPMALVRQPGRKVLALAHGEGISTGFAAFTLPDDAHLSLLETEAFFENGAVSHEMPN